MEQRVKAWFESLTPKDIGLTNQIVVSSVERLGAGWSNINFLVIANNHKYIFRLNLDKENSSKSKREYEVLTSIEKHNMAPKAWLYDESKQTFENDFIVIDYIEGIMVNNSEHYQSPTLMPLLADLYVKLHSIHLEELPNLPEWRTLYGTKRYIEALRKEKGDYALSNVDEETRRALEDAFERVSEENTYEPDRVLIHGDPYHENIIYDDKNQVLRLIDFEDTSVGDRAADIAGLFVDFGREFSEEEKGMFLRKYAEGVNIDAHQLRNKIDMWIKPVQLLVLISALTHALRIQKGDLHAEFLQEKDIKGAHASLQRAFDKCVELGIIYTRFNIVEKVKTIHGKPSI